MRSKLSFSGHPVHPALVHFPIAFLSAAFLANLAGSFTGNGPLWSAGSVLALAGILTGLIAAIPGLIDYLTVVPPESSAKKRATTHMVSVIATLALFALALTLRGSIFDAPTTMELVLEAFGMGTLAAAGWTGGTLVYRNQIGVDHRYANAGRWNVKRVGESLAAGPVEVAFANELEVDQMKLVHLGDSRIVVARTEHGYAAFDDRCSHRGGSLADGSFICGTVQCPVHGSQFDAHTGDVRAGPAATGIRTYAAFERGGRVWLQSPPQSRSTEVRAWQTDRPITPAQPATAEITMNTEQLMTKNPVSVVATDTAQHAAELLEEHDCGCLPVVESPSSNRLVGVVTDRDIALRGVACGKPVDTPVRDLMSTDVAVVAAADDVDVVRKVMSDRQVRRVVVVDDARRCVGIVSQADLALAAKHDGEEREVARVVERISQPAADHL